MFHRWQRDGSRRRVLTRLQSLADAKGAIAWDLGVDSRVCPPISMRPEPRSGLTCREDRRWRVRRAG